MKKEVTILIIVLSLIILAGAESNLNELSVSNEIIVKYKDNVQIAEGNKILKNNELIIYDSIEEPINVQPISQLIQTLTFNSHNTEYLIEQYKTIEEIEFVEPNYLYQITEIPNDPSYSNQYH